MADSDRTLTTFGQLIADGVLEIGDGYRAKNEELGGDGPIFLRAGHVTDTHFDFTGVERFHGSLADKVRSKMSQVGDAVITTKGNSTGRTAFVNESIPQFVYSPHLSYWRSLDTNKLKPGFLRFWSKSAEFAGQLASMKASTDMAPYLSLVDQRRLKVTLPTPDEQDAIAHILGAFDDKIELNRRMNETLEAIARALFKSWFMDFEPIRAKAEGLTPAHTRALWSLFPSTYDPNEGPTGWHSGTLLDLCELKRGYDLPTGQRSPGSYPIVSSSGISGFHSAPMAQGPGVVTGRYGTIGEVYFINEAYWPLNTALYVRDFKGNCPRFVFYALQHVDFLQYSDKAAVPGINRNHLHQAPMVVPPHAVQQEFEKLLTPIWAKQEANKAESATLTALRNTLLPKLISGELRVKTAEKIVEAVA